MVSMVPIDTMHGFLMSTQLSGIYKPGSSISNRQYIQLTLWKGFLVLRIHKEIA